MPVILKLKYVRSGLLLIMALLFIPAITTAQDLPCNDADPYSNCVTPLDTWVIVLVVPALFFGYRQIQKQKILAV